MSHFRPCILLSCAPYFLIVGFVLAETFSFTPSLEYSTMFYYPWCNERDVGMDGSMGY